MEHRMLVAELAATLFMLTAATGSSAADSCTAPLPPLFLGGDECPAPGDDELVDSVIQNVTALLEGVVHCMLGHTPEFPANSCTELAEQKPDIPSGNYWILNSTKSPVQVFCEMGEVFPASLNVTGGWVRVANLNMTDPNQQCPGNLNQSYTNPLRLCGRKTDSSCDSVTFTTYGVQYRQVCGRVRGYQFGTPDGFERWTYCPAPCTIDNPYVDGVSITHGSPRKHIWTYAVGLYEYLLSPEPPYPSATCPCTGHGDPPPRFVGSDYYCETALNNGSGKYPWDPARFYPDDPLWDGQDCHRSERTCCDPPNLPWFCNELLESTTDDLEVRVCADQPRGDEDVPINLVQLYIQ